MLSPWRRLRPTDLPSLSRWGNLRCRQMLHHPVRVMGRATRTNHEFLKSGKLGKIGRKKHIGFLGFRDDLTFRNILAGGIDAQILTDL